jgi:fructose-1,6-bisphosphatase/inositol monophosphatase family enzyme
MATFTIDDLDRLSSALTQVAAEELMPRFGAVTALQIHRKTSAFDIVTDADEASETAITGLLGAAFPGAIVIGEESAGRDPRLLDALGSAQLAFLIDPLDGTRNFASGLPLFGVMAAAVMRGEVVAGVIHDPVSGTTALGLRDKGAWMQDRSGARQRMRVAAPVPLREMEGIAGTNFLPEPLRERVSARLSRLGMTNWFRCAAHEYRLAAGGHCHILFYNRLMPWDHAAGWLLHREAGGYGMHFDGSPYLPTHSSGGLLYAPDHDAWESVRAALLE